MHARPSPFRLFLLFAGVTVAAACSGESVTGPTATEVPRSLSSQGQAPFVGVGPAQIVFLPATLCPAAPPFGLYLTIVVRTGHDLLLRGVRFDFEDRFGTRVVPAAIPTPSRGIPTGLPVPLPTAMPLPVPTATTIPFPGTSPVPIPAAARFELPFFLQFDCGVVPTGILVIVVETVDGRGKSDVSRLSVRIGG